MTMGNSDDENGEICLTENSNAEQDVDSLLGHAVAAEIDVHRVTKDDSISLGNRSAVKLRNLFRDICCNLGDVAGV